MPARPLVEPGQPGQPGQPDVAPEPASWLRPPGGIGLRAAVGGALVAGAMLLALTVARVDAAPTTSFVVASRDIAPGARLSPDALATFPMSLAEPVRRGAFTSAEDLAGVTTIGPLAAGELVQAANLESAAAGAGRPRSELSLLLSPDRAMHGELRAGERVDLLATFGLGPTGTTEIVSADVTVLSVDDQAPVGLVDDGAIGLTVQLSDPTTMLPTVHAARADALTVVRSAEPARG